MARLIIFGAGDIAQLAHDYFTEDSPHEVAAFTVDRAYLPGATFEGKPVVPFETVEKHYPPDRYRMFVALSYRDMNRLRERKCREAKEKGYSLVSYVSSRCSYLSAYPPGENCFILEDCTVQPFARIGRNVMLWSGGFIAHHAEVKDHTFIGAHAVVSGHCVVEPYAFIGAGAVLAHWVKIAEGTLVGAGAVVTRDTEPWRVIVPPRAAALEGKRSTDFEL